MLLCSDIHFSLQSQQALDALLEEAAHHDSIIITGDFVQRGFVSQFKLANHFLQRLGTQCAVVVTPGNHDLGDVIGEWIPALSFGQSRYIEYIHTPLLDQRALVASYGLDTIHQIEQDIFVSLNSNQKGSIFPLAGPNRIEPQQVQWARTMLESYRAERVHLITHRSLWKHKKDLHRPIAPSLALETLLKDFNFYSFIHGHNHRFLSRKLLTPLLQYPIHQLSLPTLSRRHRRSEQSCGFVRWHPPHPPQAVIL